MSLVTGSHNGAEQSRISPALHVATPCQQLRPESSYAHTSINPFWNPRRDPSQSWRGLARHAGSLAANSQGSRRRKLGAETTQHCHGWLLPYGFLPLIFPETAGRWFSSCHPSQWGHACRANPCATIPIIINVLNHMLCRSPRCLATCIAWRRVAMHGRPGFQRHQQ